MSGFGGFGGGVGNFPTVQQVQALPDVAPSYMWTIDIFPPGAGNIPAVSNIRVLSVSLPFTYINNKDVFRAASTIYFPHFSNIENISINFLETQDLFMLQAVQAWQNLIVDVNGNYGLPINYMGNIVLTLRDTTGLSQGTCTLYGIWPKQLDAWQLSYEQATHLAVQVEFSTNYSVFTFANGGITNGGAGGGSNLPNGGNGGPGEGGLTV